MRAPGPLRKGSVIQWFQFSDAPLTDKHFDWLSAESFLFEFLILSVTFSSPKSPPTPTTGKYSTEVCMQTDGKKVCISSGYTPLADKHNEPVQMVPQWLPSASLPPGGKCKSKAIPNSRNRAIKKLLPMHSIWQIGRLRREVPLQSILKKITR